MRPWGGAIYAVSALAIGGAGLAWGDFASVWQPVPADFPFRTPIAYLAAMAFVCLGGVLLAGRGGRRTAAFGLAALHLLFSLLWLRRIVAFPELIGTCSGFAELLVLAIAALLLALRPGDEGPTLRIRRDLHAVFGLCLVTFGLAHFGALEATAGLVPGWIPPDRTFWAAATGLAHIAAGIALLANVQSLLAGRLVTLMFVGFALLVWAPGLVQSPEHHITWAGNSINLALVAAAWVVSDSIDLCRRHAGESGGPFPRPSPPSRLRGTLQS